ELRRVVLRRADLASHMAREGCAWRRSAASQAKCAVAAVARGAGNFLLVGELSWLVPGGTHPAGLPCRREVDRRYLVTAQPAHGAGRCRRATGGVPDGTGTAGVADKSVWHSPADLQSDLRGQSQPGSHP